MKKIIVRVEPSKKLPAMFGWPYFIGGLVTKEDLEKMEKRLEIQKAIPIKD